LIALLTFDEDSLKLPGGPSVGARLDAIDKTLRQRYPEFASATEVSDAANSCMAKQDAASCPSSLISRYLNELGPWVMAATSGQGRDQAAWDAQHLRLCPIANTVPQSERPGENGAGAGAKGYLASHPFFVVISLLIAAVSALLGRSVWLGRRRPDKIGRTDTVS
jgi:hypothetical protein